MGVPVHPRPRLVKQATTCSTRTTRIDRSGADACRSWLGHPMSHVPTRRFLTLDEVAEELATSVAQVTALVHRGELRALKLGGRGQWRVQRGDLEDFIAAAYRQTQEYLQGGGVDESEQESE